MKSGEFITVKLMFKQKKMLKSREVCLAKMNKTTVTK